MEAERKQYYKCTRTNDNIALINTANIKQTSSLALLLFVCDISISSG